MIPLAPRIRKVEEKLVASTGWLSLIPTAGLWIRTLVVEPERKRILIKNRYLWFFLQKRVIRFHEVTAVTYKYEDVSPDQWLGGAYLSLDQFSVGLRLVKDEDIGLFSFSGGGAYVYDVWPVWALWPSWEIQLPGSQESTSRLFVELLSWMLDVEVIPGS